jgi:hypothetical protein
MHRCKMLEFEGKSYRPQRSFSWVMDAASMAI